MTYNKNIINKLSITKKSLWSLVLVAKEKIYSEDNPGNLISIKKSIGKKENWAKIRWITRDDNYRARSLYDKVATKTNWTMYEMETDV